MPTLDELHAQQQTILAELIDPNTQQAYGDVWQLTGDDARLHLRITLPYPAQQQQAQLEQIVQTALNDTRELTLEIEHEISQYATQGNLPGLNG